MRNRTKIAKRREMQVFDVMRKMDKLKKEGREEGKQGYLSIFPFGFICK